MVSDRNALGESAEHGLFWWSIPMRSSLHVPIAPGRKVGAWVCLVAVMLLWSPLWAAAWHIEGMACCSGGFCPMRGHARTTGSEDATRTEQPVDCEHHGGGSQNHGQGMDCAMSCGHESSSNLTTAVMFVLPGPANLSQPPQVIATIGSFTPVSFAPALEPLSPPPRMVLSSL